MSAEDAATRVFPHGYVLAVHDLPREAAYYIDQLGFALEREDADNWRGLIRDDVRMMLGRCPEAIPAADLGDHSYFAFIATPDVDALHREFVARGAEVLALPKDKPWGWREMPVRTPEGFRIMFAQYIK
jgi:predicted enzyme related to lactoylglutathione lyase